MKHRRGLIITLTTLALAGVAATAAWRSARTAEQDFHSARRNLAESARHASTIQKARQKPARVRHEAIDPATLTRHFESAANRSGIAAGELERIWPQPGQPLAGGIYQRYATQLVIREATLTQIIRFLENASRSDVTLNADRLRITAPRSPLQTGRETWRLEAQFSYLLLIPADRGLPAANALTVKPSQPDRDS